MGSVCWGRGVPHTSQALRESIPPISGSGFRFLGTVEHIRAQQSTVEHSREQPGQSSTESSALMNWSVELRVDGSRLRVLASRFRV